MVNHGGHTKEFIVGAVVGSLLGGVAALLAAPSTGKKLRDDVCDAYDHLSDKAKDLADRGRLIAKNIGCQTCDWTGKAKSVVDGAAKKVKGWVGDEVKEEEHTSKELLIGGLIGGVVGVTLALLLAPKSGSELRQEIADAYEDVSEKTHEYADSITTKGKAFAKATNTKANKWLALAQTLVNELSEDAQEKGEELVDHVKDLVNNKRMSEILDWAHLGFRAWHGLQSKKRK